MGTVEEDPGKRGARLTILVFGAVYALFFSLALDFGEPYFRPYERLVREPVFSRSTRVEMDEHGVFSYRVGAEALKLRHPVVFTTDPSGFRNPPLSSAPKVAVLGDSFVFGVGLSDEETLPRRLAHALQVEVYNYGATGVEAVPLFLSDGRFRASPAKVALLVLGSKDLDRIRMPKAMSKEELLEARRARDNPSLWRRISKWQDEVTGGFNRQNEALNRDNGLTQLARRLINGLRVELFGPPGAIFPDGEWALVDSLAAQRLFEPASARPVDPMVEALVQFKDALSRSGTALVVCPVPEAGVVYPELFPEEERRRLASPSFFEVAVERLTAAGIEVIDLRPVFERHKRPYLYLRDDNHWTPRTVELVAAQLAPRLRELLLPQAPAAR